MVSAPGIRPHSPVVIASRKIGSPSAAFLPVHAAFPVAEEHLAQVALDDGFEADPLRERRRRLVGAPQTGDVDRVDLLLGQTHAELFGLPSPLGGELGITVPVGEGEGLIGSRRCRFTVAHDEQFGRAGRWRESILTEPFGFR